MIKTERQYQQARVLYQEGTEQLQRQVEALKLREYSEDEIKCLTGCTARMLEENKKLWICINACGPKTPRRWGTLFKPSVDRLAHLPRFISLNWLPCSEFPH